MATTCEICGKGVAYGHNVSHSHRKTPRRWIPNIQKTTIFVGGNAQRLRHRHVVAGGRDAGAGVEMDEGAGGASLEGAILLARAQRSTAPLRIVARELAPVLDA